MRKKFPVSRLVALKGAALCAIFFLSLQAANGQAQGKLLADSNHVETGNPLRLVLQIPKSAGRPDSLDFSAWKQVLPPKNIIEENDWQEDNGHYRKTLKVLFFQADSLQLPSLALPLSSGDTLFFPAFDLVVTATPSPDDLNDLADIKDIHREPVYWTDFLPWILGGAGVLAFIFLLFWWAKRKRITRMQSRSMEIPPHERALKKLALLEANDWIRQGKVKEHYAELTFILREYLEHRFGIPALESTTAETLQYLGGAPFTDTQRDLLGYVLEQADLAKFARITPTETFHAEAFDIARNLIAVTRPDTTEPVP